MKQEFPTGTNLFPHQGRKIGVTESHHGSSMICPDCLDSYKATSIPPTPRWEALECSPVKLGLAKGWRCLAQKHSQQQRQGTPTSRHSKGEMRMSWARNEPVCSKDLVEGQNEFGWFVLSWDSLVAAQTRGGRLEITFWSLEMKFEGKENCFKGGPGMKGN